MIIPMSNARDPLNPDPRNRDINYTIRSDGFWVWSDVLPYYCKKYNIAIPSEFLEHMRDVDYTVGELTKESTISLEEYMNKS
jgi:hypothetical protein